MLFNTVNLYTYKNKAVDDFFASLTRYIQLLSNLLGGIQLQIVYQKLIRLILQFVFSLPQFLILIKDFFCKCNTLLILFTYLVFFYAKKKYLCRKNIKIENNPNHDSILFGGKSYQCFFKIRKYTKKANRKQAKYTKFWLLIIQ